MTLPNRQNDWDWAQVQYETTPKTADVIADEIGVSTTQVISRASRMGWTRNRAVSTINLTAELAAASRMTQVEEHRVRYEAIERVNQLMQAEVLTNHRRDIKQARKLCTDLFKELERGDIALDVDENSKIVARLASAFKTFILLERQAYGIVGAIVDPEDEQQPENVPASALGTILEKFASVLQTNARGHAPRPTPMADIVDVASNGPSTSHP